MKRDGGLSVRQESESCAIDTHPPASDCASLWFPFFSKELVWTGWLHGAENCTGQNGYATERRCPRLFQTFLSNFSSCHSQGDQSKLFKTKWYVRCIQYELVVRGLGSEWGDVG